MRGSVSEDSPYWFLTCPRISSIWMLRTSPSSSQAQIEKSGNLCPLVTLFPCCYWSINLDLIVTTPNKSHRCLCLALSVEYGLTYRWLRPLVWNSICSERIGWILLIIKVWNTWAPYCFHFILHLLPLYCLDDLYLDCCWRATLICFCSFSLWCLKVQRPRTQRWSLKL